jgi:subfamily B ATP-binding cassette protein HlyB/CyaB
MSDSTLTTSSGLAALMMLARLQGVEADQDQLRNQLGVDNIRLPEMIRAAKLLGFDASAIHATWQLMAEAALPGIAALRTGEFLVVAKIADDKILVQYPLAPKPQVLTRAEFEAIWGTAGCF